MQSIHPRNFGTDWKINCNHIQSITVYHILILSSIKLEIKQFCQMVLFILICFLWLFNTVCEIVKWTFDEIRISCLFCYIQKRTCVVFITPLTIWNQAPDLLLKSVLREFIPQGETVENKILCCFDDFITYENCLELKHSFDKNKYIIKSLVF